jgi:hypothetical protein
MVYNPFVKITVPLSKCLGLINLISTCNEANETFELWGLQCEIQRHEDKAVFQCVQNNFGFVVIYPGWWLGEHAQPVHIFLEGEVSSILQWLQICSEDKAALVNMLPVDDVERDILMLSV